MPSIYMIISVLVEKLILTEAEGEALAEKMRFATRPSDYRTSRVLMKKLFEEIEKEK